MKKFIMAALSLFFFTQCALGFSACNAGKEHEHVFEEEWRHNAQTHWHFCTVPGCNERGFEEAHTDWELIETTVQPTCFTRGEGKFKCAVCGEIKQDYIEPTGDHEWSDWKAAEEYHYKVCAKKEQGCTAEIHEEHVPGKPVLQSVAREYKDGVETVSCTVCNRLLQEIITPATRVAHAFKMTITSDNEAFLYFSELDENWHMTVNVGSWYDYSYSDGFTAGEEPTSIFDYDKVLSAGVKVSMIDMKTDNSYTLLESADLPSINAPANCFNGRFRIQESGQYKMIFRFTYIGYKGYKETSRVEFVVDSYNWNEYLAWFEKWNSESHEGTEITNVLTATPST